MRQQISAGVDGRLSRGSSLCRPGSEDPHRCVTIIQCYSCSVLQLYSVTVIQCYSYPVVLSYSGTVLQWYHCSLLLPYSFTVIQFYRHTVVPVCTVAIIQWHIVVLYIQWIVHIVLLADIGTVIQS